MRDLRHLRSPLFLSFFLFFGRTINLEQFIAKKDHGGVSHPLPRGECYPWAHSAKWKFVGCVSIQGLHPSMDPAFMAFEDKSFKETLLTVSTVVKWDGLDFGAFPGCVTRCFTLTSQFLLPRPAKVTIYTMLPFSLS